MMRYLVFILLFISVGLEAQNINQLRPDTAAGSIPMTVAPYFRQAYARPETVADTLIKYIGLDSFYITNDTICLRLFSTSPIVCLELPAGGGGSADSLGTAFADTRVILGDGTRGGKTSANLTYEEVSSSSFLNLDGTANAVLNMNSIGGSGRPRLYFNVGGTLYWDFSGSATNLTWSNSSFTPVFEMVQSGSLTLGGYAAGAFNEPSPYRLLGLTSTGIVKSVTGANAKTFIGIDGSETSVTAGTGISVSGSGTTGSPYVISNLAVPDGSETKVTAGSGISVSGTGLISDPYVVTNTINPDGTSIANTQVAFSNGSTLIGDGDLTFIQGSNTFNTINQNVNGTINLLAVGGLRNKAGTNDWRQYAVGNNLYHEPETVDGQIFHRNFANTTTMTFSSSTGNLNTLGYMQPQGGIRDPGNSLGTTGQVLTSTGTTIDWVSPSAIDFGIALNHVPYGTGTGLTSEAAFNYNPSTNLLSADNLLSHRLTIDASAGITFDLSTGPDINFFHNGTNFYSDFSTSPTWYIRNNTGTSPVDVLRFDMGANIAYLYDTLQLNNGLRDAAGSSGTSGQFLKSTGTDVVWDDLPSGGDGIYGGSGTVGGGSSVTASVNAGTFFQVDYNSGTGAFGISSATAFMNHVSGVKIGDTDELGEELLIDGFTGGSRIRNENATGSRIALYASGNIELASEHGTDVADIFITAEDEISITGGATGGNVTIGSGGVTSITDDGFFGADADNKIEILTNSNVAVIGHDDFTQGSSAVLGSQLLIYGNVGGGADGNVYLNARGETTSDLNFSAAENIGILAGAAGSGHISTTGDVGINRAPATNDLEVQGTASKAAAGDWLANSDQRLKKNIKQIDSKDALNLILSLRGVNYEWNEISKTLGYDRAEGKQWGMIAQDIQKTFGNDEHFVQQDSSGYLNAAYGTYDPLYIESIRYLYEENQQQSAQIEVLTDQVNNLYEIINELKKSLK